MTKEQLYEILGDISEKHIQEAKEVQKSKIERFNKLEDKSMSKKAKRIAAVAVLTIGVCVTGVTTLATNGKLQGYFKDIINFKGAVIGTGYEQATEEVEISIVEVSKEIKLEINMINPKVAPYSSFELFGIKSYEIVDESGNVIVKDMATEMAEVINGTVIATISLDDISSGEYTLIISEMTGSSKADQPLILSGEWECGFMVE